MIVISQVLEILKDDDFKVCFLTVPNKIPRVVLASSGSLKQTALK